MQSESVFKSERRKGIVGKKLNQVMDLIDSFNQIELHAKGKKKLKSAKEFLNKI